ncbi:MAG: thiolase C-terminal domain-containing protein [Acidimicrobiia bacterium]
MTAPRRVGIVASAQTELRSAWPGHQHVDLISHAVTRALAGSGLRLEDVDFVIDSGSDVLDGRSISNCGFLGALGAHHKEESRVEEDGLWAALYGVTKIAAGSADVGLIVAYSKPSESDLATFYWTQCEPFYQRPVGLDHVAASGLQAQAYLGEFGLSPEIFARVVARDWSAAARNPWVDVAAAPGADEVAASPPAARPLRRLEMSRPVDGAVAVLLATEQVARRVTPTPVWVTGMGTALDQHSFARRARSSLPACRAAAEMAYRRAGIEDPAGMSLVETGAGSATGELMVLEALGLAEAGRAIGLYDGAAGIAVNPSGGSLPADPVMATGLVRLSEASLQLSGRVDHAPPGATTAIVHGTGGVGMQNHCVFTLEAAA